MSFKVIPVNRPKINSNGIREIKKALTQKWISGEGPIIEKFENNFKKIIGTRFSIAVSNGTAALEIAISSLNLTPGSKVALPNFTIVSCLNAVIKNNLKPVFIDVDKNDYNICIKDLKKKMNKSIKALIMVHTYGLASNIREILKLKKKYKFMIIEDCAEGIGLKYKKKFLGNYGDLSTFSFYSNKLITTGEGGCILTNKSVLHTRCKSLRNLSFGKKNRFKHKKVSGNFRLGSLQCAYGLAELKSFNSNIKLKIKIGEYYNQKLKNINFLKLPPIKNNTSNNVYWVYPVLIKKKKKINKISFVNFLKKNGVLTRDFFFPLSQQPFLKKYYIKKNILNNSRYLHLNGLYLPCGLGNTFSEIKKVCKVIKSYESKYSG